MTDLRTKTVVLIAINDFLMGGAQKMMADLASHMDQDAYEIHILILTDFPGRPSFRSKIPEYCIVHELSMRALFNVAGWGSVLKVLSIVRPDVILSNLYFSNTVLRVAGAYYRIPVIAVEHNTYSNKNFIQHTVDWALSFVTFRIVAVSQEVAAFVIERQHVRKDKVVVIPNGIDLEGIRRMSQSFSKETVREELHIPTEDRVVLHVGRLVAQKDPRLLLAGFALFSQRSATPCWLIVVGGGSLEPELKAEAQRLGITERVIFVGPADPSQYYVASDIFASTSLIEGFGLVRAEALAYGLPVVTTFTGGTSDMIQDGHNGVLVCDRTPEAVAEGMVHVFAGDREDMSRMARRSSERYSIEDMTRAYTSLVDESVKKNR
jgi:glycosyltransferase involved in cell wall biosynthesis